MKTQKKLGQLPATAICGNDISSSVLYVSGLAIAFAGQYAWITLLMVSVVLYLFRKIYGEVVGALPLNGGTYNALLNTTTKSTASFAATLTILSYMATSVISANEAIHYLHHVLPAIPIILTTIILLSLFALLVIIGISESSVVAVIIFVFHLISLLLLTGFIIHYLYQHGIITLFDNWRSPMQSDSVIKAIFFGFAASMLGVSGFESSANFVEQQAKGVFPKTLRNMWVIVSVVNPLMAVFALALFTLPVLQSQQYQSTLLIQMADQVGGNGLAYVIAVDAFLVLSGAVLTSFVGVTGLLERMTLDRIMPQFLMKKNNRGSSYRIVMLFLLLSVSVLMITHGDVKLLAGVYTLSFLSVMALFGIGNMLLKVRRSQLPRPEMASWTSVILAVIAVLFALIGNIMMPTKAHHASNISIFLSYFIPAIAFVAIMLHRIVILKIILHSMNALFTPIRKWVAKIDIKIQNLISHINAQEFVFFTKGDDIATLNKAMQYISKNEHSKNLKIVTITQSDNSTKENLEQQIHFIDQEYPRINIKFITIEGTFSPQLIHELSEKWYIPTNFMFIGSPNADSPYRIEELGGVRLII